MGFMKTTAVKSVTVTGATEWSSEEYKTVQRFSRGSQTIKVLVKDEAGKPAMRPTRFITISVLCVDGVAYRFIYHVTGRHMADQPLRYVRVHGHSYDLPSYQALPEAIEAPHQDARRRCHAMLRIMSAQVAGLPKFRPLPAKAA